MYSAVDSGNDIYIIYILYRYIIVTCVIAITLTCTVIKINVS
jgi:hypothetical protein